MTRGEKKKCSFLSLCVDLRDILEMGLMQVSTVANGH